MVVNSTSKAALTGRDVKCPPLFRPRPGSTECNYIEWVKKDYQFLLLLFHEIARPQWLPIRFHAICLSLLPSGREGAWDFLVMKYH